MATRVNNEFTNLWRVKDELFDDESLTLYWAYHSMYGWRGVQRAWLYSARKCFFPFHLTLFKQFECWVLMFPRQIHHVPALKPSIQTAVRIGNGCEWNSKDPLMLRFIDLEYQRQCLYHIWSIGVSTHCWRNSTSLLRNQNNLIRSISLANSRHWRRRSL